MSAPAAPTATPLPRRVAGMSGGVRLRASSVAGRTRITELSCRPPVQVLRAHHVDPDRPDIASVILASPSGGILQGDRLSIDLAVGSGAALRVGTQSATRLYRSPDAEACQEVRLEVASGGLLEYLPEPIIPFAGSCFRSETVGVVATDATLVLWEVVGAGRVSRGEILAFDRFESTLEILRPDGTLLATDTVTLDRAVSIQAIGNLGRHRAVGTLFVVRQDVDPERLRDAVRDDRFDPAIAIGDISVGASSLPNRAGAWLRVLGAGHGDVLAALAAARRGIPFG
jgi:urease accessory protein